MFHVDKNVIARYSVATRALNPVPKTAHHVKNPAKTPANTASARENVASLANPASAPKSYMDRVQGPSA